MKNILKYSLLAIPIILLFLSFFPRKYNVPSQQKRASTKYWDLATGSRIGYTLVSGKGPKMPFPIIYLHGGPGGPIYDSNIKSLSSLAEDGYDVYLYDQIGGGHSERLKNIEEYTVERHKRDLEEIVKIIGAEKVILIGQSWGAMLATIFVTDNSEKVEKMILTSPGPILPIRRELANLKAPDSLHLKAPIFTNQQGNKKAHNWRTKLMLKWAVILGKKLASDEEADSFATYLNQELNKSTVCDTSIVLEARGGAGFYVQIRTVKSFGEVPDQRSRLKEIDLPILVMKGQCDNQKWGYTNEYLELFPNAQLVVLPNAGHGIATEQPELYLKNSSAFLNK